MTLLALLFAPLGLMGGHAAMARPDAAVMAHGQADAPAGHCADMDRDQTGQKSPNIDCTIVCSAVPTVEFAVASHPAAHGVMPIGALDSLPPGLHPESDPPPPRFS